MNTIYAKGLFFIVRWLRRENVRRYIKEVKDVESYNEHELYRFQVGKLKKIFFESGEIPYLRNILNERGLNNSFLENIIDLERIPIVDKNFLINHFDEYKHNLVSQHFSRGTSGSTGQPFIFLRDRFSLAYMDAVMYQVYTWHNIQIGDPQARFWGVPFGAFKRSVARTKDFLMNRMRFSAFDLSEQYMYNYFKLIKKFRPSYIYGYPSLIYMFTQFCKENNLSLSDLKIKAVIVTGEKLISFQGKCIEDFFSTKLVQEYGCSEIGVIAFQCEKGNMHVMSPNVIVEVVKNDRPVLDEPGEIVVTELNARSYPFIRYKIGDIGVLLSGKCSCGLSWPLMEINEGRVDDYIITSNGRKVYDAILAYTFNKFHEQVTAFKAVQEKPGYLDIMLKVSNSYNANTESECLIYMKKSLGEDCVITMRQVENIPCEKSGKFRYFESKLY